MGRRGLGTVSPKGQSGGAISVGREGWLALFQREFITALKTQTEVCSIYCCLAEKNYSKCGGKNCWPWERLPGRGLRMLPGMDVDADGALGAVAGAGTLSPSGEESRGGWEAAAICRLHGKSFPRHNLLLNGITRSVVPLPSANTSIKTNINFH